MKLVRYGDVGQEKPGLLDASGRIRDLSGTVKDINGDALSPAGLAKLKALDPASLPLVDGNPRLGAPVGDITKFVAIGLNYADHAAEAGMAIPSEPIVFIKEGDIVRTRKVQTGIRDDQYIEITSGLKPGDVVVSGSYKAISKDLEDSSRVTVLAKGKTTASASGGK